MHLYALDNQGKIIPVHKAGKQQNYCCLECKGPVRRRAGRQRTPHFFHLRPSIACRQHAKSMAHLQVQFQLQSILPANDCQLEYHFPAIKRIADVIWFSKKLIFEVQCSPIHPDEIRNRNQDYATQGYQVIWLLHDHRFNRWKLSAAENYLQLSPHYYTNIDSDGQGFIYDQFYLIEKGTRKDKRQLLPIDLTQPLILDSLSKSTVNNFPKMLSNRILHWPIYFLGDLVHHGLDNPKNYMLKDLEEEQQLKLNWVQHLKKIIIKYIVRPYDLAFKMLLEKVCK